VGRLRRQGLIPAILYGARVEPTPLALSPREVNRALQDHAGGGVLVQLRLPDQAETQAAIIRELQFDPVRETLLHVDLQAVRMDEEITVEVPIHVVGEAAGVKEQNGILAVLTRNVEITCLPAVIPDRLDIDVSSLRIHDVATAGDLVLPDGVRLVTSPTQAVATVSPPAAEEAPAAVAAPAEPEVVSERKAPEETAER
jgi:large subunit ribosomal protein L25